MFQWHYLKLHLLFIHSWIITDFIKYVIQSTSHFTPRGCKMRFSSTGENGRKPSLICKNILGIYETIVTFLVSMKQLLHSWYLWNNGYIFGIYETIVTFLVSMKQLLHSCYLWNNCYIIGIYETIVTEWL